MSITSATALAPSGAVSAASLLQATYVGTLDGGYDASAYKFEIRDADTDALVNSTGGTGHSFLSGETLSVAGPALADGSYKIRFGIAQFNSGTDATSAYTFSTFITFTVAAAHDPTVSLVSPSVGATVSTLTPTLVVGFSDPDVGAFGTFAAYQLQVRRASDATSFWDPGQVATSGAEQTARQVSVVYAGTTLVNGTGYEWRARVQDGGGAWSAYSSWQAFTPGISPFPPSSIAPSGLQTTLTPTVSGVYNRGAAAVEADFQYEIRQNLTTIYQSGDVATAIATGQAYGTNNSADTPSTPPALAWGTSYNIRMRSKDAAANYSDWSSWVAFSTKSAPTTPTSLSPTGGAVTPDTTPDLAWVHNDPESAAQTHVEIELYDLTAAAYVSGYHPKALTQATLTHTVATSLTLTHNYQWRIRTEGNTGPGFGSWSDWQLFSVADVPAVSLTAPTAEQVVGTASFSVAWSFSGGSGTQQDYRIKVFAADGVTVAYDSGVVAGVATSALLGAGVLHNLGSYYAQATVRDTLSQSAVTSLVHFTTSWTPPDPVTGLSAVPVGLQT